ncbi:T9SS type A sorting domain-containing protein [Arenibacter certesii]|uniref:T9SS C-terminal target domain-containing protein n=1 Tax=Arenibacter certesii TaxID=228955 RepID=A0A918MRB2_9FLAO|nr:T9SS type A sorting domain-containing protein [Arenibacter certesii]GGW47239.1 T9SS C-terminal target domain-containing protein [Arenibacter certesii]
MKQLYLIVTFLFLSFSYGQDSKGNSGDIDGFKLYPNPATNGRVYISTTLNAPKKVLIFDIFGTKVLETTLLGMELKLDNLDSGVYMLRITEKNKIATRKLIIK